MTLPFVLFAVASVFLAKAVWIVISHYRRPVMGREGIDHAPDPAPSNVIDSAAFAQAMKTDQDPEYKAKVIRLKDRMLDAKKRH